MEPATKVIAPLTSDAGGDLYALAQNAYKLAVEHGWETRQPDGHWNGELLSNATIIAEQLNGSWSIAPDYPGDVFISAEAYLAFKILGVPPYYEAIRRGCAFIYYCGGVAAKIYHLSDLDGANGELDP
ncbi:squalene cyclase [Apiospora aurea]|uniref:Squalene cyclase n=1 Tax=Apiospora aurea TaxID=335848 RepID=A0ABR1PU07_9PEZI